MKNVKKLGAALGLLAATSMVPVFAQSSNTKVATASTILSDADKFMDVKYFDEVNFDKIYAFTNLSRYDFQLGIGTKTKKNYLGFYYNGNFWGNLNGNGSENKDGTVSNSTSTINANNFHNFNFLLGLSNMGFKFDLDFNLGESSTTENKTAVNSTLAKYRNNEYFFGVEWAGLEKSFEKFSLLPNAAIGAVITDGSSSTTTYDKDGKLITKTTRSYNESNPSIASNTDIDLALGFDFAFNNKNLKKSILNIGYECNFDIYPTNWTSTENGEGKVQQCIQHQNKSSFNNYLTADYRLEYAPIENLTLAATTSIGIGLDYFNKGNTVTYVNNTKISDTPEDKTFTTTIETDFGIGVKYNVKPNFALNFGYAGQIPTINMVSTTHGDDSTKFETKTGNAYYDGGVEKWNGTYTSSLSAGFSWNIGKNCLLDCGTFWDRTPSLSSIWTQGWNLAFTYKK